MAGQRGLFIPGPTNIPEAVRRAMSVPSEDHRAPDLPAFMVPLLRDLKDVFKTKAGEVLLFPSSGTGGWEAAILNTLSPGDKVLTARFGQFSLLWASMCERLGLDVEVIDVEWGAGAPLDKIAERLRQDTSHAIKAVLVCHNETATGVTSDIGGVRAGLDASGHPALLFVDGVSSIASIDLRFDEWGVDVAVSGSQKGFMLPAGLAIVAVSQKAMAACASAGSRRCYFDFQAMSRVARDGYFPYTPPMALLRGLRCSLDLLASEGLENVFARHQRLAASVRAAVAAWNLELVAVAPVWHSNTVSAIYLPEGFDSNAFVRHAYERYQLSLGVGLNRLSGRAFRIGHLGDLNELMVLSALAGTELVMRDMGLAVREGSGVGAAIRSLGQPVATAQSAAA
jgi:alanine-glyoxylate transaminase/serine-glyoxylate transaminase/serine-pyruvate transaminase